MIQTQPGTPRDHRCDRAVIPARPVAHNARVANPAQSEAQ
jgi:hypothetical protein